MAVTSLFPDLETNIVDVADESDFIDSSRLGRYAEFVVCAELTRFGYHVIHVDAPGFDLILVVEDQSLRVQVKSTTSIINPPSATGKGKLSRRQPYARWTCRQHVHASNGGKNSDSDRYSRPLSASDADIVALFHHKFNTMFFVPVVSIKSGSITMPLSQIKQADGAASLRATLARLGVPPA